MISLSLMIKLVRDPKNPDINNVTNMVFFALFFQTNSLTLCLLVFYAGIKPLQAVWTPTRLDVIRILTVWHSGGISEIIFQKCLF